MKTITISAPQKKISTNIQLPASKSISNRALIIQALSRLKFPIKNLSEADDTLLMGNLLDIIAKHQRTNDAIALDCKNAGTVFRFLSAYLSITPGNWILTGDARMEERPIGILVDALTELGADIRYLKKAGFPPLQINGKMLSGGKIEIDGSISSQFISALLMIAPHLENGLTIRLKNSIASLPYIDMTLGLMNHFGVTTSIHDDNIRVKHQKYQPNPLTIEADWSSAAFWFELAAFSDEADIVLNNLRFQPLNHRESNPFLNETTTMHQASFQGDAILPEIYQNFGVLTEVHDNGIRLTKKGSRVTTFDFNFSNHPDLAQPVILTCAGLGIKGQFDGLESLRIKETDRISALEIELAKAGFSVELEGNTINFRHHQNRETKSMISINSHADHRMAMSFAPLALLLGSIQIENPDVVSKSYPRFWSDLMYAGFRIEF